jgi:signal transduction histidine kinase/DNA-binding NarL/FixJ family response regulator/HPt (histidine-containing phosphotransfer) domain-containing protein
MKAAEPKFAVTKFSAVAAIIFMAAFLLVNAVTFVEGTRRLAIIDGLNRLDIPQLITVIDEMLWRADNIVDHRDQAEEQTDFARHILNLNERFKQLEINARSIANDQELAPHFEEIFKALEKAATLYTHIYKDEKQRQETFEPIMDDVNFHFNRIAIWSLDRHQQVVSQALDRLREREQFLRITGLAFVTLGCLAIIFLVLDLCRRDELLLNARQAERMKSSFFAMMSHEIRTPINGVLGMLTLLLESTLNPQQIQMAKMAKGSAEGLLNIVNDVLDFSKIEAGKLELEITDFSLKELIDDVVGLMGPLARNKGLDLSYTIASELPDAVRADPTRVRQILFNFLSNAVKFTEAGQVQLQVLREQALFEGGMKPVIRFNVTDTGIGISPEERQILFREFSQVEGSLNRRFTGTGLGLAISARLANIMKGDIGVVSEKGKGSTFWFTVPLQETSLPAQTRKTETFTSPVKPAEILVVEDNLTNQVIAASFLRNSGHKVDVASDGAEAIMRVKSKNYDLVFMDVSMPVMDGLAATRAIRDMSGRNKHLPILAMTAHAMRGDREQCLRAGMNGYLAKPATRDALLQAVHRWADRDAILSCHDHANSPHHNPDGSLVQPHVESPCADGVFPFQDNEIRDEAFCQLFNDLGRNGFMEYGKVFHADISKVGCKMIDAAGKEDWSAVRLHAHSIKSSVLNFGLVNLSAFAEKIEHQCEVDGKADRHLIGEFPEAWQVATAALNQRFKALGLPTF